MNQLYIYIYPHISSLLHLPVSHAPYNTPLGGHKALSWSPCAMRCLTLAFWFIFGSVYMSMPLSHFVPAYTSHSPCPQVHSLVGLRFYSRPAPRFFMTTFFFFKIPYICVSIRYLLYSFWLTSLCMTVSRSIHLTINNSISFLFIAE